MTDQTERNRFFVLLKFLYNFMPESFRKQIPFAKSKANKGFYRWVQDERAKLGADNASIKELNPEQFKEFINDFLSFYYSNILGFYRSIDTVLETKDIIESEFKTFLDV